jgi:hypothetical protein
MTLSREQELLLRRERLLSRSDLLRKDIAEQARAFSPRLAWAAQAHEGWRWMKAHPEWVIGPAVALVVLRPRRVFGWGSRLLGAWRLWQRTRPLWSALAARLR